MQSTIVIADTSPLNYLVLIDAIEVLPILYGHVLITETVLAALYSRDMPTRIESEMKTTVN